MMRISPRAAAIGGVLAGGAIMSAAMGARQTFGLFITPFSYDRGLPVTEIAFAIALHNLVWGLAQPFAGSAADRYGAAPVIAFGSLTYAAGLALAAISSSGPMLVLSMGILVGIGISCSSFGVILPAVGRAASPERRSLVMGLVSAAGSLGQVLLVPVAQGLSSAAGMSTALLVLAAILLAVAPLGLFLERRGDALPRPRSEPAPSVSEALAQAFGNRGYRLLTIGFFTCGFQLAFIATHLPGYLSLCNMPVGLGATALALIGLFNMAGSWGCGWLGGRFRQQHVLGWLYLVRGAVIAAFFLLPKSETSVIVFAAIMGLTWLGTVPLTSGLVAKVFGLRHLGTLFGIVLPQPSDRLVSRRLAGRLRPRRDRLLFAGLGRHGRFGTCRRGAPLPDRRCACYPGAMPDKPDMTPPAGRAGFVQVRGAREHNLKNVDIDIPRDALVVFTGVSGSGKSSLAFSTLYAEAQRRYLESVSPYARRLFDQLSVPDVDSIEGLPPAVALQQQRGSPTTRSSVGSVTTLSNLLRMLYSRAGDYPPGQPHLEAEAFSANTPEGACPRCHGLGRVHEVSEDSMVPNPGLTIRQRAVAAWPLAWGGQNLRDILITLGIDVDLPWRELPKKTRDWILFTDEQPSVPVYPGFDRDEVQRAIRRKQEPAYMGTFSSAQRHVTHSFATTQSAMMKRRAALYMISSPCPTCDGKRLRRESLSVTFAGLDLAEMIRQPMKRFSDLFAPYADPDAPLLVRLRESNPEKAIVVQRIAADLCKRLAVLLDLGLGYLTLERSTPTLSPGELQRLRLATQVVSNLFGVVYVLDEPSAGLHPADTEALLRALDGLKAVGNSLFVVEHELDVVRHADWIVDVGPAAGELGGRVLYSGPLDGLEGVEDSETARHLFAREAPPQRQARSPKGWLRLSGVGRNNLRDVEAAFPLGVMTTVTGISGSGKSSLVSQALVELVSDALGSPVAAEEPLDAEIALEQEPVEASQGRIEGGLSGVKRLIEVDQKPIGRTPRSNLATYTGLFDHVRALFAATPEAKRRRYDAGRFSFNVAKGRCPRCEGEGFVMVELLFLPSVYAPCPDCHGTRYNAETLEISYRGKTIADVLNLTVEGACAFFADAPAVSRSLTILRDVGLHYLRLGQPATELSGGEAQRIKLATELQKSQKGGALYVLDEPTTGLHPSDVERLLKQLDALVEAGNSVILVEHDMSVAAASDWVIDIGPGAGEEGGRIVASGVPASIAKTAASRTAPYLRRQLTGA